MAANLLSGETLGAVCQAKRYPIPVVRGEEQLKVILVNVLRNMKPVCLDQI